MPSKINWGIDRLETLEVTGGCTKCPPGCQNCWAIKNVWRMASKKTLAKKWGGLVKKDKNGKLQWTGTIRLFPEALKDKKLRGKGKRIFIDSKADIFHPKVPFRFIEKVMATIEENPQHEFMILTKRADRMAEYFNGLGKRYELSCCPNVHLGVTICNQAEADEKIPILLKIPAAHRFISVEPLLEPVDFTEIYLAEYFCPKCREFFDYPEAYTCPNCGEDTTKAVQDDNGQITCNACNEAFESDEEEYCCPKCDNSQGGRYIGPHPSETIMRSDIEGAVLEKLDYVIIGCESGSKRRPIARKHIKDLYDQCKAAGVKVMVKQMAENEDGTGKVIHNLEWIKAELGD